MLTPMLHISAKFVSVNEGNESLLGAHMATFKIPTAIYKYRFLMHVPENKMPMRYVFYP